MAEHVVLTPSGMRFAPYPVVTFADQMKYHEQAILRFYEEHDVVYEKYLSAALVVSLPSGGPPGRDDRRLGRGEQTQSRSTCGHCGTL